MRPSRLFAFTARVALPLALAIASLSPAAIAAPSGKDRASARALAGEARRAMRDKRWADAISALKRAERLDPNPALALDLAQAQIAAGKLVDAQRTLGAAVAGIDGASPARRARAAAKKALDNLGARVPTVKVTVTGAPAVQVSTLVDGIEVDGDEIPLDPGDHTISAEAKGYTPAEQEVHLAEGAHQDVRLRLIARADAHAGDKDKEREPDQDRKGSRVPGVVLTSIGAAGLAVGGVFGGLAFQATSTARAECQGNVCPAGAAADISRSKLYGDMSTGMFIAGGAVAVVGIALIIAAPGGGKPDEAPRAGVARVWVGGVGPGAAGLGATGSF